MEDQMSNIVKAEHIQIKRIALLGGLTVPYYHHAIRFYNKDGTDFVIHYTGDLSNLRGEVKVDTLKNFIATSSEAQIEVVNYEKNLPLEQVIKNAFSRVGECAYDLMKNNCEHLATACFYGKSYSKQAQSLQTFLQFLAIMNPELTRQLQTPQNQRVNTSVSSQ